MKRTLKFYVTVAIGACLAAVAIAACVPKLLPAMLGTWLAAEGISKALLLLKGGMLLGITNTPAGASQAANTAANSFNATNCDPRLIEIDDAMSLTRANITGWNKSDIEGNMFKEVGLDKIISQTKEARMAGARQRTLTDLLLSRHAALKMGGNVSGQSVIQPFRLVPRRNRVNPGYFRVSAGATLANFTGQGGAGGGNTTTFTGIFNGAWVPNAAIGALWVLTVNNGSIDADSSPFAKSPNNVLKNPEKYFLPRHVLFSEYLNNGSKVTAQLRVIDSAAGPDANQCYVLVCPSQTFKGDSTVPNGTLIPNGNTPAQSTGAFGNLGTGTNGWWESANGAAQGVYQPTTGLVTIGVNAVSDFQQYGNSLPGVNDYGLIEYWPQTYRWVHQYNDAYVEALSAATTSEGLKKFRLLPLAKLRAQQEKLTEDFKFNTFFYGQAENENQTITQWQNLPVITDPAWAASGQTGTLALDYQTRTLGIRTQIAACGNVYDNQGAPLDVDALFEAIYYIKREREGESLAEVTDIDIMTDQRFTRPLFRQIMTKYYKAKYGLDTVTQFTQMGQKIVHEGQVVFEYDSYELPDNGCTIHVFSNQYFDDKVAQFQNGQKSAGRALWIIDWSDIAVNVIKSMSVNRTNNLVSDVYKFVMRQNVQHIQMNSFKFEVAVGNTNRHRIIENYSDACAKLTVPGCDLTLNK